MKNPFLSCFLLFVVLAACSEAPKETEPAATVVAQPIDTLDLLSENFIRHASADTTTTISEESSTPKGVETFEHSSEKAGPGEEAVKKEPEKRAEKKKKKRRKKPVISFETESYSFGRIMQGKEKAFEFKFKNTGNADLQIVDVTATCGCTVPSFPFIPIGPGEEGFIGVTYNSTGKLGPQKPVVTVITNASPKTYKLRLEGIVDAERED